MVPPSHPQHRGGGGGNSSGLDANYPPPLTVGQRRPSAEATVTLPPPPSPLSPPCPAPPPLPNPRHGDRPAPPPGPRAQPGAHSMYGRPICRVIGTAIERPPGGL